METTAGMGTNRWLAGIGIVGEGAVDGKQRGQVTTGVVLIVLGLIFFAGQQVAAFSLHQLWPMLPLVFGLGQLLLPGDGRRGSGAWLVFIGAIFLLHNYNVLTLRESWPLFCRRDRSVDRVSRSARPARAGQGQLPW